jgi:D-arabinose 1-dehydrogenase-like Zn-dependent alcohol dehydrogenase
MRKPPAAMAPTFSSPERWVVRDCHDIAQTRRRRCRRHRLGTNCAEKRINVDIELIRMADINAAYVRMEESDVKYRFVIDIRTL